MSEMMSSPRALQSDQHSVPLNILLLDDAADCSSPQLPRHDTSAEEPCLKKRTPEWFSAMVASNGREKRRLHDEFGRMKGTLPLLLKPREGAAWSPQEKGQIKALVRSASSVSPYLLIWVVPGSMLLLPFLAWYLDRKRRGKSAR